MLKGFIKKLETAFFYFICISQEKIPNKKFQIPPFLNQLTSSNGTPQHPIAKTKGRWMVRNNSFKRPH